MEVLIETNGEVEFLIECDADKEVSLKFKVFKVVGYTDVEQKKINDYELEEFFEGTIKWDGCSHFFFDYIHLCGKRDYDMLYKVLDALWVKAEKEIKGFDKDVAY